MTREWPSALHPYVGPTPNAVTLRPARWASGQLAVFLGSCVAFIAGVIATALDSDHRVGGFAFISVAVAGAWISGRDRQKWTRVQTTDDAIEVASGVWRKTSRRERILFADVQTVRVQNDQRTYGYKIPIRRHVVIDHVAAPFSGPAPEIRIAEMFCIDERVLEALRDELAARAGKTPLATTA